MFYPQTQTFNKTDVGTKSQLGTDFYRKCITFVQISFIPDQSIIDFEPQTRKRTITFIFTQLVLIFLQA